MKYQILQGDNRETLKTIADNSIDAIVTDPPYGIDFLGKSWDANTGALETYQECLRVLKPGGHIVAFSAARTYHHLAITLEQAGFEIRDQIMWIYSSGFPKSQDVGRSIQRSLGVKETKASKGMNAYSKIDGVKGPATWMNPGNATKDDYPEKNPEVVCTDLEAKQWAGWGTQLKPAHEPIALARKPLHKNNSIAKNCQEWGVGAINIDATRVKADDLQEIANWHARYQYTAGSKATFNNILSEAQGKERQQHDGKQDSIKAQEDILKGRFPSNVLGEIALYQKYFYCPKVSKSERHIQNQVENNHPTVKPVELMKYLIKLITPPGGIVLDPFNGSGSTGCAAVELGYEYIGCELDPAYVDIAKTRIEAWNKTDTNFKELFEECP